MAGQRNRRTVVHIDVWVRLVGVLVAVAVVVTTPTSPAALGVALGIAHVLATVVVRMLGPNRILDGILGLGDIVLVQWVVHVTGGLAGPGSYLLLLHAAAAGLMGTRRAGMQVALLHAAGLFVVRELVNLELVRAPAALDEGHRLGWVIVGIWLAAVAMSWLSTLNERELRSHRRDLEAQASLATRLASASDEATVCEALLDHVEEMFGSPRTVLISTPPGAFPEVLAARRIAATAAPGEQVRAASVLRRSAEQGRTLLVRDLDPIDDVWLGELLPGARNLTLVPLVAGGATLAVVVTEHGRQSTSRIENRAVVAIERAADHTALALTSVRLREALTRHALTDALTGVDNRRAFDVELNRQLALADRQHGIVSLMLVDLDHFKELNDEHGHAVGDDVLSRVGASLLEVVRPNDTVARYGGEEFAVILPQTTTEEALEVAERVRLQIRGVATARGVGVTASAGVATVGADAGLDPRRLIREADMALYAAKAAGRDCVRSYWTPRRAINAHDVRDNASHGHNTPTRHTTTPA